MITNYYDRCALGMRDISNDLLVTKAKTIQNALSNPIFNTISPSPAEVNIVWTAFAEAQEQVSLRNYRLVPVRNNLRKELLKLLRAQCDGVNNLAQGNPDILAVCGFDLHKKPKRHPVPAKGVVLSISAGVERRAFVIKMKGEKGRDFYLIEVLEENGNRHLFSTTKTSYVIAEFEEGARLQVFVRTSNAAGFGPWSEGVNYIVPLIATQNIKTTNSDAHIGAIQEK